MDKQKIYFASDFHLGIPSLKESHNREKHVIQWLNEIEKDAKAIYLLGDIFDFWFEYRKVVPKGFVRLLGKIATLIDNGTEIHLFVGNHDLWANKYLEQELGIIIHYESKIIEEHGKKIFISHGDGLGKGDYLYKFIRKIFTSKICQWLFSILHPDFGISLAHAWSNNSRKRKTAAKYISEEKELLFGYCKKQQKMNPVDYYIFGHRHIPLELEINDQAKYINVGDWINYKTYSMLNEGKLTLERYKTTQQATCL